MILALNKQGALHVFFDKVEAESYLEAIDVQHDAFEFCDDQGQRYSPIYTNPPKVTQLGPLRWANIGAFKLMAEGKLDPSLPKSFLGRAAHLEHCSAPSIGDIEVLRKKLQKGA